MHASVIKARSRGSVGTAGAAGPGRIDNAVPVSAEISSKADGFIQSANRRGAIVTELTLRFAMGRDADVLETGDVNQIAEANAELHEEIVTLAENSLLENMMRSVSGRDRWIFRMTSDRDPVVACREHHELCKAVYAGNAELACAISYSHIEKGRTATLGTLKLVLPEG